MNMVTDRMILTREMMEETRRDFGEAVTVYQSTIPRTSQFGGAKKAQQIIFEFAPRGKQLEYDMITTSRADLETQMQRNELAART